MKQEEKNKKNSKNSRLIAEKKQDFTNNYGKVKKLKLGHKNWGASE